MSLQRLPWMLALLLFAGPLAGCQDIREGGVPSEISQEHSVERPKREALKPTVKTPGEEHDSERREGEVERLRINVLAAYPHDPKAFTQGLVFDGGVLYESTGLYGTSSLRRVDPLQGKILDHRLLEANFFGEGLALVEDRLVQLTWKEGIALVYSLPRLEVVEEFSYYGEGWGLAWSGEHLVMSDGSDRLTVRDPVDFQPLETIAVTFRGRPQNRLNELEFAGPDLYANIWTEDRIVRIDLDSGEVTASIDASELLSSGERRQAEVLNGIAYDPVSETFWITGKLWPKLFQVSFVPDPTPSPLP